MSRLLAEPSRCLPVCMVATVGCWPIWALRANVEPASAISHASRLSSSSSEELSDGYPVTGVKLGDDDVLEAAFAAVNWVSW